MSRLDTPMNTLESFRDAVVAQRWSRAASCLSKQLRSENGDMVETAEFYQTEYWISSRTFYNALGPAPLITKDARFEVQVTAPRAAQAQVRYTKPRDKEIRIQELRLALEDQDQWHITEMYGETSLRQE